MKKIRTKNLKRRHEEKGFILFVSIIVMTCMLLLVTPFLFQLSSANRLTQKSCKSSVAISLAEAGIERAIWELNYGDISTWEGDISLRTLTISDFQTSGGNVMGDIDIKVTDPEGENPVIESTGKVSLTDSQELVARTTMVSLEEEGPLHLFDHAVFAGGEGVDLFSNAKIDSYDSTLGSYGGPNVGSNGDVGTNASGSGCIFLAPNAKIYGDAVSGPGSDPATHIVVGTNAEIFGERQSLSRQKRMPSVAAPVGLSFGGDYYLGGNDSATISESGEYSSFTLDSNAEVTITADVTLYITGDFSMRSNTQLEIADGVSVTIYLGGSFEQSSNTSINNLSEDPTKLLVFGTDSFNGEMEWNSNSDFWGAVYAPKADVNFRSNSDFYGSIVGKSFELASNARFHYDEALSDLSLDVDPENFFYLVKSWQEKTIT
ncbi:MAG: hypothetical protein KAU46_12240 [Candidatus Aminicenantes bacterium]|nr:hypothetical protein [Candidatus Aminicenantes bacterium]